MFSVKVSEMRNMWILKSVSYTHLDVYKRQLQDREQWDLSGDIIDCFRRYSSELSPEEQEEIIKGIEEGMTDQDVKRYFTLVGAEKMRQYRRVLMVAKIRGCLLYTSRCV